MKSKKRKESMNPSAVVPKENERNNSSNFIFQIDISLKFYLFILYLFCVLWSINYDILHWLFCLFVVYCKHHQSVRIPSEYSLACRFAPNIVKKGYDSIAVSSIRPYCMVKKTDKHCTKCMTTCCFVCASLLLQSTRVALDWNFYYCIYFAARSKLQSTRVALDWNSNNII